MRLIQSIQTSALCLLLIAAMTPAATAGDKGHASGQTALCLETDSQSSASQRLLPWHETSRFGPEALRRSPHLPRLRIRADKSYRHVERSPGDGRS